MCGICGVVLATEEVPRATVENMNNTLRRRGPDDAGFFVAGNVGIAMRRLSIIDVHGSRQPIWSDDRRYVGVFNGEIYNYRELRQELQKRGRRFTTNGDGEVILNLFSEHGQDAFRMLRGMFAVAIWDSLERRLWLVRDPLGIKPLFYSKRGNGLIFGSEIKAVMASRLVGTGLDPAALDAFLAFTYIPAPLSIYREVRKLQPGCLLEWSVDGLKQRRYWALEDEAQRQHATVSDIRDALAASISAHLVSDVPVGAFLSGGIDSSAIVAQMQGFMETPLRAYTVRFDSAGSHLFDETPYARALQKRCGFEMEEHEVRLESSKSLRESMLAFDEPFADDSIVPSYEIFRIAARELKVCVSGAGGDELFGGYNRYQGLALQTTLDRIVPRFAQGPGRVGLSAAARLLGMHTRRGDLIHRFAAQMGRPIRDVYASYITSLPWNDRQEIYRRERMAEVDPDETRALVLRHFDAYDRDDPVGAAMYTDVQTYLPEDVLALSDRIGMWHSLEIRVPLADRELATLAFSKHSRAHVTFRKKKISLRRAVKDWLPPEILSHPKQGFESPMAAWLRGDVGHGFEATLSDPPDEWSEYIRSDTVLRHLHEHRAGRADRAKILFALLVLMEWMKARQAGLLEGVA